MSAPASSSPAPKVPVEKLAKALSDPTRWRILLELAKGEALPVWELGRRAGTSPNLASKHMVVLREAGLVVKGYGYQLPREMRPAPGATHLDLGYCKLLLDAPLSSTPQP